jgi:tellurite resistance protein TehA-like permease
MDNPGRVPGTAWAAPGPPTGRAQAPAPRSAAGTSPHLLPTLVPSGLVTWAIATLDPGYFAWAMATGIISVAMGLLGHHVLSDITLWVAVVAFCALVLAHLVRAISWWPLFRSSFFDPSLLVAYFTFVAGAGVLSARLVMAGHPGVSLGLGAAAATAWAGLNYGLPWSVVARSRRPVLRDFTGTWLLWVVATQSLSIVGAGLVASTHSPAGKAGLAEAAACLWGVGTVLYLALIVIILLRLIVVEVTPAEMGPGYWITMGATAISVLAAARLLGLPPVAGGFPLGELHPYLLGTALVFWSFGSWWVPLLILFGFWRHLLRRFSLAYEPRLWSMVFPLGMYTAASYRLGQASGFGFMVTIAKVWVWVGFGAWAAVLALIALALLRALPRPRQGSPSVQRG